jgi:hypothetical protein
MRNIWINRVTDMDDGLYVWWSSSLPITEYSLKRYPVRSIPEARKKLKELEKRDLKDKRITDNIGGLNMNTDDEEVTWYCEKCGGDIDECKCKYK